MTHTTVIKFQWVFGNKRVVVAEVDVTSYTANGEAITPAELGLAQIDHVEINSQEKVNTVWFDHSSNKIRAIVPNTGVEVAGAADAGVVRMSVYGA